MQVGVILCAVFVPFLSFSHHSFPPENWWAALKNVKFETLKKNYLKLTFILVHAFENKGLVQEAVVFKSHNLGAPPMAKEKALIGVSCSRG
jgi:hypothetical protein